MKITNLFIRRNKTINLLKKMTYMENNSPIFSVIIPVYNRPQEVEELLESLSMQKKGVFETIIVEDGSSEKCEEVCKKFSSAVPCRYYYKENGGPAEARNFGASKANGQWLLFFDSDCILPEQYMEKAIEGVEKEECQLFGGADRSHPSFTTFASSFFPSLIRAPISLLLEFFKVLKSSPFSYIHDILYLIFLLHLQVLIFHLEISF